MRLSERTPGSSQWSVTATLVDALGNARTLTRTISVDLPKPTCTARRKGRALKVTFTLSYKIRAARKGRYAVVLTISGQPTRTVVVSV